jgi:hypothetical protein
MGGGGSPVGGSGGGGNAGSGGDPNPPCITEQECASFKTPPGQGVPPPPDGGGAPDGPAPLRHVVSRWFFGELEFEGGVSIDAWKDYGFDLDGWSSTAKQGFHCKPASGAKATDIRADGNKGIDNSFGKNIVNGILATLISNPSDEASSAVEQGGKTILLDLGNLGAAASYSNAPAQWLRVSGEGEAPSGDWSSFAWRPFQGSTTPLSGAYLAQNVWVSGEAKEVVVTLELFGFPLKLPIQRARVSVDLKNRKKGVGGQLGGIVSTEDMTLQIKLFVENLGSNFCSSSALEGVLESVRQASDILLDGTQDPEKVCDGISLGMGFESRATSLGSEVVEAPTPDPCE